MFQKIPLPPFTYEHVREALSQHLQEPIDNLKVRRLAAHILFLSGGHPGLMARIISLYEDSYSISRFIEKYIKDTWATDLTEVINEITRGLFERNPELLTISGGFCVNRYFNRSIAENILEELGFIESKAQAYKLSEMKSHGLYLYKGSLYSDGLVSTLLALWIGVKEKTKFSELCKRGKKLCLREMNEDYFHAKWFLEYIYISLLQQSIENDLQNSDGRGKAEKGFHADFKILLSAFKNFSSEKEKRTDSLLDVLEKELSDYILHREDEECSVSLEKKDVNLDSIKASFRFLVNYVLSGQNYDDKYFEEEFIHFVIDSARNELCPGG